MFQRLRVKEGWSYGAWAGIQASAKDRFGQVFAGAILAPQNITKARAAMIEELRGVRRRLGRGGAAGRAAAIALEMLGGRAA